MKRFLAGFFFTLMPALLHSQTALSIKINGTINPASADFISSSIQKAESEKAECLIITLNTPGGLLKSTRVIVGRMLKANVPIIVFVSPAGAQSGSAGVFITLAANVAAMAAGTNIGAAHPVTLKGTSDSIMSQKSTNDAAAFIRTIAEQRKRNLQWAEEAVRKSVSITEKEALDKHVIDLIADSEQELLARVDGRQIDVFSGIKTLHTKNVRIKVIEMSLVQKLLNIIGDPDIAYLTMMIGFAGILFELFNPGAILPGIVGVISLILAFYAMHSLPINYAGVALIIFGLILLLLEVKILSHGMLAIGGICSLLFGSIMLLRTDSTLGIAQISYSVIILTSIVTASFFLFVISAGLKAQRAKPIIGIDALLGRKGETMGILNTTGTVRVQGEIWNAESISGVIGSGEKVRVTGIKGLTLYVEACTDT